MAFKKNVVAVLNATVAQLARLLFSQRPWSKAQVQLSSGSACLANIYLIGCDAYPL